MDTAHIPFDCTSSPPAWDDAHIAGSGAVGLWTEADSVTAVEDFRYGSAR